ncbi:MAG: hypothetical protein K0U29_05460 [Gammaproteobacteria bacterium]|nr:hypothetical protein [Gammaproteobacteria bacterium]
MFDPFIHYKCIFNSIFRELFSMLTTTPGVEGHQVGEYNVDEIYLSEPGLVDEWAESKQAEVGRYHPPHKHYAEISITGVVYLVSAIQSCSPDHSSFCHLWFSEWTDGSEMKIFNHLFKIMRKNTVYDEYRLLGNLRSYALEWMSYAFSKSDVAIETRLERWQQWRAEPIFAAHRGMLQFGKTATVKKIDAIITALEYERYIKALALTIEQKLSSDAREPSELSRQAAKYFFNSTTVGYKADLDGFFQKLEWQEDGLPAIPLLNILFQMISDDRSLERHVRYDLLGTIRMKSFEWVKGKIDQFDMPKQVGIWKKIKVQPIFAKRRDDYVPDSPDAPATTTVENINKIISKLEGSIAASARDNERARTAIAKSLFFHSPVFDRSLVDGEAVEAEPLKKP